MIWKSQETYVWSWCRGRGVKSKSTRCKKGKTERSVHNLGPRRELFCRWPRQIDGFSELNIFLAIYGCILTQPAESCCGLKFGPQIQILSWWENGMSKHYWKVEFCLITCGWIRALRQVQCAQYLRSKQGDLEDPTDSILFGPSPSNQVCVQFKLWQFIIVIMKQE